MAQGRGGNPGVFPAQQRALGDPAVIERGKGIYVTTCSACHGPDLRGGTTGGPNLLRSQVVLSDQHGELILPIVHGARAERGMPVLPLPDPDVVAVAEYIHSVAARLRAVRELLPRTRRRRQTRLSATRSRARPTSRRNAAAAIRRPEICRASVRECPRVRRCRTPGSTGTPLVDDAGAAAAQHPDRRLRIPRAVIATITLPGGETVQGPVGAMDNFLITVRQADGTQRTIRRVGDTPKVELKDPLAGLQGAPHPVDGQGHARRNSVPGGVEMTFKRVLFAPPPLAAPVLLSAQGSASTRPSSSSRSRIPGPPTLQTTQGSASAR